MEALAAEFPRSCSSTPRASSRTTPTSATTSAGSTRPATSRVSPPVKPGVRQHRLRRRSRIPEVIRGINAFTLGVRAATQRPPSRSTGPRPGSTRRWRATPPRRCSTTAPTSSPCTRTPPRPARRPRRRARWVSYNSDMSKFAPNRTRLRHLGLGPVLHSVIQAVADGTYHGGSYWGGMADGIVKLGSLADDVSQETRDLIDQRTQEMIDGTWDPFTGPINDQDGNEMVADGEVPDDGTLLSMCTFVEGVNGSTEGC
ncbi:MAG: hypothetical protein R2695_08195 [Acidimicrobiales bacterium]